MIWFAIGVLAGAASTVVLVVLRRPAHRLEGPRMTSAKAARIIPILFLAACAHVEPKVVYKPIPTPVVQKCIPATLPAKPEVETPAQLAAVPDGPERYVRLAAAYLVLFARSLESEPVIQACR